MKKDLNLQCPAKAEALDIPSSERGETAMDDSLRLPHRWRTGWPPCSEGPLSV